MENTNDFNVAEELNYLRSLLESLDNQLSVLTRGMDEVRKAYSALKEEAIATSKDVKVSLGAGIFIKANIDPKEKLFVPIGSNLYVEEDPEKSAERLEKNVRELDESIQNVQSRRSDISGRYNSLVSLVQQAQSEQSQKS